MLAYPDRNTPVHIAKYTRQGATDSSLFGSRSARLSSALRAVSCFTDGARRATKGSNDGPDPLRSPRG
jgi:hypothetical protein